MLFNPGVALIALMYSSTGVQAGPAPVAAPELEPRVVEATKTKTTSRFYSTSATLSASISTTTPSISTISSAPSTTPIPSTSITTVSDPWCIVSQQSPYITASTPSTPVTGLELTVGGANATLSTTGWRGGLNYAGGGLGAFDACHYWWLNIGKGSHSYKPVTWDYDKKVTKSWIGGPGRVITVKNMTSFLACPDGPYAWTLLLQTGSDVPKGAGCVATELQEAGVLV